MRFSITNNCKIYVLAPGKITSGGPEALHQLCHYLNNSGYDAYMYYWTGDNEITYKHYNVKMADIIEDKCENVIITPESYTKVLHQYKYIQKGIWWLGVQYYDGFQTLSNTNISKLIRFLRRSLPREVFSLGYKILSFIKGKDFIQTPYVPERRTLHLCGSLFAYNFVKQYFGHAKMFVEPISEKFLKYGIPILKSSNREDIVLYNPAKPSELLSKLLEHKEIKFVPIKDLNIDQMVDLFRRSKLYIDFGYFGGPERLPKETVFNGTLLLVGKRNASINNFDVAIPDHYKIENFDDVEYVVNKIKFMLSNYDNLIDDFSKFRNQISGLEAQFLQSIKLIFKNI